MSKPKYWQRRFLQIDIDREKDNEEYIKTLDKRIDQMSREINQEIHSWVKKYAKNDSISEDDAKELLSKTEQKKWKMSLDEFKRKAKAGGYTQELNREYYKSRISRLELLEAQIAHRMAEYASIERESLERYLGEGYHETYLRNIYELDDLGSLTSDFAGLTTSQIDTALNARWKGGNFSSRVWGNYVRDLPKKLDKTLTASMTNGWGVDRTVKAMMENIDSGLRNRMTTLVQTEMAHLADEASQLAYERKGVKEYEWLATLELHTCELCGNFDGQTFIVGSKNAKRPIVDSHPNCRCTTVPSVNFPGLKRWSRDPITGKGKLVDDMSFNEWRDKYTNPVMLKKVRNESSDKKQYGKYKDILGSKDKPETFDKFQEMKYNEDSGWDQLKDNYFVKSRLKDGRYGSVINQDKQAPHMRSTVAEGKSYFNDDVNVQDLFDKYAGTGTIERQKDGVTRKNTELIIANDFKGVAVSLKGNQETSTFKIHHAKKRTHIVPIKERGES